MTLHTKMTIETPGCIYDNFIERRLCIHQRLFHCMLQEETTSDETATTGETSTSGETSATPQETLVRNLTSATHAHTHTHTLIECENRMFNDS